jgi:hypothetical protein
MQREWRAKMEKLYLLTDKALDELKRTINIEKYNNSSPFIEEQFSGRQYRTSIEILAELPELYFKSREEEPLWIQDFNNAKMLHQAINSKKVSLRYLTDERFWAYLTHTMYWDYLQKRWPATNEERIKENWFFKGGSQVFSRQSLVRLWWRAECSYDERLTDPYEITKIAFDFADPFNQIIERKISKSRKVFRCALIALRDTPNASKLKWDENRTKFGKAINTIAGVKLIELLSEEELIKMFKEQIEYIVN